MDLAMDTMRGDRALGRDETDKLGFRPLAARIATALTSQASRQGFVFGIEGKWGTGKSSFLNLVTEEIQRKDPKSIIVEFRPWLVGDRDALLTHLFADLAKTLEAHAIREGRITAAAKKRLTTAAALVRSFGGRLGIVGKLAALGGTIVPGFSVAGELLDKAAAALKKEDEAPPLLDAKSALSDQLAQLGNLIFVTIDDVDRLDPEEAVEILRLVRSVADFRNVCYVLCYDEEVLGSCVEVATRIDSGREFIEKIVQASIKVPDPEAFALRRWFSEELRIFADDLPPHSVSAVEAVIDAEGGRYLTTPRKVIKVLNAVLLFWPALQGRVDLSDVVWLQMIRAGDPRLYRWIEDYSREHAASVARKMAVSDADQRRLSADLWTILDAEEPTQGRETLRRLSVHLPGIAASRFSEDMEGTLFNPVHPDEAARLSRTSRLASPDHSRFYFALVSPANVPEPSEIERLLVLLGRKGEEADDLFVAWVRQKSPTGASMADAVLSNLAERYAERLTHEQSVRLVGLLGRRMDSAAGDSGGAVVPAVWRSGRHLLIRLQEALGESAEVRLRALFRNAASLGWITYLLREELYAHARVGEAARPDKLLSEAMLSDMVTVMDQRYSGMEIESALRSNFFRSYLETWRDAAGIEKPRNYVKKMLAIKVFLDLVGVFLTRAGKNGETRIDFDLHAAGQFLDLDQVEKRLAEAVRGEHQPYAAKAKPLFGAFTRAKLNAMKEDGRSAVDVPSGQAS